MKKKKKKELNILPDWISQASILLRIGSETKTEDEETDSSFVEVSKFEKSGFPKIVYR